MNTTVSYPDSNKVGQFQILDQILEDGRESPLLAALFSLCTVLKKWPHESGRGVVYIAASELFQPLAEGATIPEYRIDVAWPDQSFKNPDHEAAALRSKGFRFVAIRQNIIRAPALAIHASTRQLH